MSDTYSEDEFVLIESPCQEVVESRPSEIESVVKEFVSRVIDTAIEKHLCLQEHLNCGSIETKNINKPTDIYNPRFILERQEDSVKTNTEIVTTPKFSSDLIGLRLTVKVIKKFRNWRPLAGNLNHHMSNVQLG